MKIMIKCRVKHIPTKVSGYQKEGQNYPHWRRSIEEVGYKPNPQDYESDDSASLDREKDDKETTIISFNEILIYMVSSFVANYERYTLSITCKVVNKVLKSRNYHLFLKKKDRLKS